MKKSILCPLVGVLALCITTSFAQTLLEENFNYSIGDSLSNHNWIAYSAPGKEPIKVHSTGLSFPGYNNSTIGNSAIINPQNTSAEDVSRSFPAISSGSLYLTFMLYVNNASSAASGYDIHFNSGTAIGCIGIRNVSGNLKFALAKRSSGSFTIANANYQLNETYLVILKYQFKTASSTDDEVSLYVFDSSAPASEPATALIGPLAIDADVVNNQLKEVCLRQFSTAQSIIIDGMRIAKTWGELALPISLLNFQAKAEDNTVTLKWSTASEFNNNYFSIERSDDGSSFETIAEIQSKGNSAYEQQYVYSDPSPITSDTYYQLKQTDFDGKFSFSKPISIDKKTSTETSVAIVKKDEDHITVTIQSASNTAASIAIYALDGLLLIRKEVYLNKEENSFELMHRSASCKLLMVTVSTATEVISKKWWSY